MIVEKNSAKNNTFPNDILTQRKKYKWKSDDTGKEEE